MIIDDVIWEVINNNHCSFKTKTETNTFCRNQFNITGLCNRNSCPLSNSRYGTVIEEKGICYLYMKTAERAHTPRELWEKVKLDKCYRIAMEQLEENLQYWPEFLKHKCKQRLTRIRQMLIKKRKMKLEGSEQYEVVSRKAEKREKSRLVKAEKSALVDKHIEEELLKNLQSGKYSSIWNVSQKNFEKVLDKQEIEEENEEEFNSEEIDNIFVGEVYGDGANDNDDELEGDDVDASEKFKDDDYDDYIDEDKKNKNKSNKSFSEDKKSTNSSRSNLNSTANSLVSKKRQRPNKNKINLEYEHDKTKVAETEKNLDW